ncbi:MAG TPA: SAM-dependent methyltransferase [Acidimicrobiales bacterium]|jgi:SAM-dependent methyltransferase|nr:SAM-dependent methyltransferase [Acidimicrobiales bacterium]
MNVSTDRQYFHEMYADVDDPWSFASSSYEQRKYALTIDTLPRELYLSAFEPGCSVGVLTELLAPRCDSLLATDIVPSALESATKRLKDFENVIVEYRAIPESWPDEVFDLVVLSEVAYYFDAPSLRDILEHVDDSTGPGAHVIAVHWRGETDYPLTGDEAHAIIDGRRRLRNVVHHLEDEFVLDLWERVK